jgi:hypothetical protein
MWVPSDTLTAKWLALPGTCGSVLKPHTQLDGRLIVEHVQLRSPNHRGCGPARQLPLPARLLSKVRCHNPHMQTAPTLSGTSWSW